MLEGKSTDVREGNTYRKHSSHDPPVVLSEGLSIRVVWTERPTERLVFIRTLPGDVSKWTCLLRAPWMSRCPALTSDRNSLRNLRPRRSHSRASVAELRTRATSFWTSCSTMDWSVGKLPGSDISFWWIFYMVNRHGGMLLEKCEHPASKHPVKSRRQISSLSELDESRKSTTYLDISNKIHFNWCKDCGSQLVYGEKILDHFLFSFSSMSHEQLAWAFPTCLLEINLLKMIKSPLS